MARNVESPQDIDITSLRKEYVQVGNLLQAGPGTPWEDRGAIGAIPAYVKTVIMSMTSPGKLFRSLRRPETPGDAGIFAAISCFFWGLAWLIQDFIAFKRSGADFEFAVQGEAWILHFVLGAGGAWILLKLITRLFFKLASAGEMRAKFPPILAANVYGYCTGPSILALIPFYIGPSVAYFWIFALAVYAAFTRLAVRKKGAIICNAIAFAGLGGVAIALYLTTKVILGWLGII